MTCIYVIHAIAKPICKTACFSLKGLMKALFL